MERGGAEPGFPIVGTPKDLMGLSERALPWPAV